MESFVLNFVAVLLLAAGPCDSAHLTHQCHSGTLRLQLNNSVLQICKHNEWKNVCSRNWGNLDAAVACRQLGYDGGYTNSTRIYNSYYEVESVSDSIVYDCTSQENHLQECAHQDYGSSCSSTQGVILTCVNKSISDPCSIGDIRFLGNTTEYEGQYIEVCTDHGLWSVVSNYRWDYADAAVACRNLGFSDSIAIPISYLRSGYQIDWLRPMEYGGLNCRGNETSIQNCSVSRYFASASYSRLSRTNDAWDFAALTCFPFPTNGNCIHGAFRLVNGYSSNNGLVEVCTHGLWVGLCPSRSYSSTRTIFSHICKHLGYQRYIELDGTVFRSNRTNPQFYLQPWYYCRSQSISSPLDCVQNYTYGFRYFQSCSQIGVLCCPNDTALCSFRPTNTTSDCVTSSAPTTTASAVISTASPSTNTPTTPPEVISDESNSKEAQFSLHFGAAATSLLLGSSSDLRGLKTDIEDKIMACVSEESDCPNKNNMAPVDEGFFAVGDTLTYTSNLDKLYCVNALKKCLEKDPWIQYHGSDIHLIASIV